MHLLSSLSLSKHQRRTEWNVNNRMKQRRERGTGGRRDGEREKVDVEKSVEVVDGGVRIA